MAITEAEVWTKAERDAAKLVEEEYPTSERARALKTFDEALRVLENSHKESWHPGVCEVCEFLSLVSR